MTHQPRFVLSIELGNDAMQTDADIADALSSIIDRLDRYPAGAPLAELNGSIRDRNGNTVGCYAVKS